jgi:putative inorganic carbon (hco3(-)) transporter
VIAAPSLVLLAVAVATVAALAYLSWVTHPAYVITGGLLLSTFSSNWGALGIPHGVAPDRYVLAAGIVGVLLRSPPMRHRSRLRIEPIHWLLLASVVYVLGSAWSAGTLFQSDAAFKLIDRFGALPFVIFLVAPLAFPTRRERNILLTALVVWAGYLGLTAFFESVGPRALVFPRYIVDPTYGYQPGRAQGPFAESVENGFALYACAVASVVAVATWRRRGARIAAGVTAGLCMLGVVFTLTRSVWLGAAVASLLALLLVREARRYLVPTIAVAGLLVVGPLTGVSGFSQRAQARVDNQGTVWERQNANQAAINMVQAKPLFGFGWNRFSTASPDYYQPAPNRPLEGRTQAQVHNAYLSNLAEIGMLGTALWLLGLVWGVGRSLTTRVDGDLRVWQIGLLAVAVCWAVVAFFVYPLSFTFTMLWLWAGIVGAGRKAAPEHVPSLVRARYITA